ncbi:MAG: hypothetical protein HPY66_2589 [Firmicutes bacterium]|nr:hypothetical protein [Bacillota bacterium]MDI6705023.1 hypothetical protein [Bacillota bacterium]
MARKIFMVLFLSLFLIVNMMPVVWAAPNIVELIKPISDIKTVNKNIIISGWADAETKLEIRTFSREVQNINGSDVYSWEEYQQPGQDQSIVIGPTGFFAKEIELKYGANKIVIKAVNAEGQEQTIDGIVTLSSKDEVREAVKNLLNTNFLDIIRKIIK